MTRGVGNILKNVTDRTAAAVALVFLSPLFLVLALIVRKDGGPAFYGHTRLGMNGKSFKCWKFRSMAVNAQELLDRLLAADPAARAEWEASFKLKDDPRVTKIGKFLRKTSLDELPQLYNVLKGEMSLVGPRPIIDEEKKYYGESLDRFLSVRPGITGLWQVSGRSDVSYDERVVLDNEYISRQSFLGDISIIFKTVGVILLRKGAY